MGEKTPGGSRAPAPGAAESPGQAPPQERPTRSSRRPGKYVTCSVASPFMHTCTHTQIHSDGREREREGGRQKGKERKRGREAKREGEKERERDRKGSRESGKKRRVRFRTLGYLQMLRYFRHSGICERSGALGCTSCVPKARTCVKRRRGAGLGACRRSRSALLACLSKPFRAACRHTWNPARFPHAILVLSFPFPQPSFH